MKTLRCPSRQGSGQADGADTGNACLSDAQIATASMIASEYKPGVTIAGLDTFPKWPLLEGAQFVLSNFGPGPKPVESPAGNAPLFSVGTMTVRYIITRDLKADSLTFDPTPWKERIRTVGTIMDVSDVSLEQFRAKGGKILMTHGTADDLIPPGNSIAYYKRQVAQFGQQRLDSFLRFYVIPGFAHGYGAFDARIDALTPLENWVEKGQEPRGLIAMDGNPNAKRTRPLCEYPMWPKFTGAPGTENSAASFTCVAR